MNREQETIRWLLPSLPQAERRSPAPLLLRLALAELRPGLLLAALALALLAGLAAARLTMPMVSVCCAAPLPLYLLWFRYYWRDDPRMRELEKTFRFSFSQMCFARFGVLAAGTAAALAVLCLAAWGRGAAPFLSLALCGAASAALLGGGLLLLSLRGKAEGLGLTAGALWMGLCVPLAGIPAMEARLAALPLWGWLIPLGLGLGMTAMGLRGGRYGRAVG